MPFKKFQNLLSIRVCASSANCRLTFPLSVTIIEIGMSRSPLVKIPSFFGGDSCGTFEGTFCEGGSGAWVVDVGTVVGVVASGAVSGAGAAGFPACGACSGCPSVVRGATGVVVVVIVNGSRSTCIGVATVVCSCGKTGL